MPYRKTVFTNDQIYHVINRGIAHAPIFFSPKEYQRFLDLIDFYRYADLPTSFSHYSKLSIPDKEKFKNNFKEKLTEIFAFCLMPNHFHFLLRQNKNGGISKMLANLQNSYARYFNLRHKRPGGLFQSMFKAIRIESEEQLLHVSRYIHLNPSSSFLVRTENLISYPWSSLVDYLKPEQTVWKFLDHQPILELANGEKRYGQFIFDRADYQRKLAEIKHLILENP